MIAIVEEPGQPQVENLENSSGCDQQVAGLHIAMDEARPVCVIQSQSRLPHIFGGIRDGHRSLLLNHFQQALPPDKFHRQKVNVDPTIRRHVDIIRPHDVGVVERSHGLGLAMEPTQVAGVGHPLGGQHLQGTEPLHHRVLGQKNRTHPSLTQQRQQPIPPQEEPLVLPLQHLLRLPHGQDLLADQEFGKRFGSGCFPMGGAEFLCRRVQLLFREQPTPLDDRQK